MQTASFNAQGKCNSCGYVRGTVKTTHCGWCDEQGVEYVDAPVLKLRTSCGRRVADLDLLDDGGMGVGLTIPKGTRGVKVGGTVRVRIERRDWFDMTETRIDLRNGGSTTTRLRLPYCDGELHSHFFFDPAL